MTLDADVLLAGPRGRRLCLEFARASALEADTDEGRDAAAAIGWAAYALTDPASRGVVLTIGPGVAPEPPAVSPEEAVEALGTIVPAPPTAARLRDALGASVDRAMYWQPPDGEDVLAALPVGRDALRGTAQLIAVSPAAQWWTTGVDVDDQWTVPWEGAGRAPEDLAASLRAWWQRTVEDEERSARRLASDPESNWSGEWWSIPPHDLVRTSGRWEPTGPPGCGSRRTSPATTPRSRCPSRPTPPG